MEDVLTQDVNAVEKLLSNGINHLQVQDKYILPPSECPHLFEVSYSESIPMVDLQDLDGPNRTRVVEEIRHAYMEDGFFQSDVLIRSSDWFKFHIWGEIAGNYAMKVRALILRLLAAVSEALGLDSSYLDRIFGKHTQLMDIMYYPPCLKPDITLRTPSHSDARGITVLMQGEVSGLQVLLMQSEASGLQVLRNGKWVAVEPIPNAFVVDMGDQL
eukprot:PITA_19649